MIIISAQAFPPSSGGIQTLMAGLAQALAAHSSVQVFADGRSGSFDANDPYAVKRYAGFKPARRRKKARAVGVAATGARGVICDSWKSAEHLPALSVPVLAYAHGNEFPTAPKPAKASRIRKSMSKVDHVLAVSNATAERVRPYLSAGTQLHVQPNPVDALSPATPEDAAWAEAFWVSDKTRLLSLSRLIPWKGVDAAISACADNPATQLVIAGDGDDRARLEDLVAASGAADRIQLVGRIDGARKTALYNAADIYLQPGRREGDQCEGFGITYLEAGLAGLPSISGNEGGAVDAVQDEVTGLIVDGTNPAQIQTALRRLIDETGLASHIGDAAQTFAKTQLWDKRIHDILALLGNDK